MLHVWETVKMHIVFSWVDLLERNHVEGLGVDGRTILELIFRKWGGRGMDWISLVRNRWRELVNAVMNHCQFL